MFTGLVEQQGQVIHNQRQGLVNQLRVRASIQEPLIGESIAVNGVCLTLLPNDEGSELLFDVSPETLSKTMLGQLQSGDTVHLERAMQVGARWGGHYVSGHVDTTACIHALTPLSGCLEMVIGGFDATAWRYLLPKGSIALDGVSLTINEVNSTTISVLLIPHTLANTRFSQCNVGDWVNVEFDYLTRVIARQVELMQRQDTCRID
jgi:riboflavin synthase